MQYILSPLFVIVERQIEFANVANLSPQGVRLVVEVGVGSSQVHVLCLITNQVDHLKDMRNEWTMNQSRSKNDYSFFPKNKLWL